ncbi:unnamed protein product [Clonostachys solani]|uniref:DUF6604 domain-containing protein n=1 Tax=Clonostachys solani TaxID=160281 RepID=A0A9N9Z1V9_9HYPO|nr:unnamed protein product [Clonostachys solani]
MPPTPLLSVYKEYKKDTNSVAAWLASTARAAGCPLSLLTDSPTTSDRLKGKDRKLGKSKKLSRDSNTYIIPVSKFIPLAEYVTSQKDPVITVPACVILAIERAIIARSDFATQLSHQGETLDTEKNKKHSHFVTVLERTRDILSSKASMSPSPASVFCPTSGQDIPDAANINRFASLGINQLPEEFTHMMAMERPEPVINDPNFYEAEQPTSFEDAKDIAHMLLKDLSNIRDEIISSWRRFKDDCWDLPAAAITSNIGLDLARFIIHQAEPIFEHHGGMVKFFEFLNWTTSEWLSGICPDANVDALRQRFYLSATSTLNTCLSLVHNKWIKQVPRCLENYDPAVSRDHMSNDEKMAADYGFLGNLFVLSANLNSYVKGLPVLDEFNREVGRVLESEKMTFFLVFAGQVSLDINHHIGKDALKIVDKMQQELKTIESTLESYLTTAEQKSREDTEIVHNIRDGLRFIKKDELFEDYDRAARGNNMEPPLPYVRHHLYKTSPILCGIIIFHFRARLYEFSTRPRAIAVIQDVAHLCHALYSEDILNLD